MCAYIVSEAGTLARTTATVACWTQWVGLGSLASPAGSERPRSIIDIEALILLSLLVSDEERRLDDMVAWWAHAGSRLTSLQRLKSLTGRFPEAAVMQGLPLFAALATESGDRRWRKVAQPVIPQWIRPRKGPSQLELIEPSALWPRLRAAFGVGAKADALVFLLGLRGAWASVSVISFATGYSGVAIRNAASEMALARLIRETEGRPAEYRAPPEPWAELLELQAARGGRGHGFEVPAWHFWSEIYAFLAHVIAWSRLQDTAPDVSERVLASKARDLMENHSKAFNFNNIPVPPPEAFKGTSASQGLLETLRVVARWMQEKM